MSSLRTVAYKYHVSDPAGVDLFLTLLFHFPGHQFEGTSTGAVSSRHLLIMYTSGGVQCPAAVAAQAPLLLGYSSTLHLFLELPPWLECAQ